MKNEGLGNKFVYSITSKEDNIFLGTMGNSVWKRSKSELVGMNTQIINTPKEFFLFQNYPNPFNPVTKIKYCIPKSYYVSIKVFDVRGDEISNPVHQILPSGIYEIEFDGSRYSSGVYFYRLESGSFVETKKMVLVK